MEYIVRLPINMSINVSVESNSEKEAIEKAIKECDLSLEGKSEKGYEIEEWDVYDKLIEGNVFYGSIYEAYAEED